MSNGSPLRIIWPKCWKNLWCRNLQEGVLTSHGSAETWSADAGKKQRLYNRWKKLKSCKKKPCKGAREAYKCYQHDTNNLLKKSQNQYINNILFEGLENKSPKSFCYYIKTQRTESSGVTPPQGEGSNTFWSWEKSEHFGKPVSLCVHSGWPWSCWYTPSRSELSTHAWCYHNRDRSEQAAKGHWSRQSFWLRPDSM